MILQLPGTWLLIVLWVPTLLISSDDRPVSDFSFFPPVVANLQYSGSTAPPASQNGEGMRYQKVIVPCLGLFLLPTSGSSSVRIWIQQLFFAQRQMQRSGDCIAAYQIALFTISENE